MHHLGCIGDRCELCVCATQTTGEAYDIITFGRSTKKSTDSQLIGMYGNGLKS